MQNIRILAVICVLGWLAGVVSVHAQENPSAATLTAQDSFEIEQLYARYNQGSDFADSAMFLSIFTEDAVFRLRPGLEIVGLKALAAWDAERTANRKKANSPPRRHWNSSLVLTPTPEGAKGRNYWLLMDVSGDQPRIYASGYHDDTFVKTPDGWRIKVRRDHGDREPTAP